MTTNTFKKALAGSAMAALLLPMAVSAHGIGFNFGGVLNLGAGGDKEKTQVEGNGTFNVNANAKTGDRNDDRGRDGDKDKKEHKEVRHNVNATTTAARIQTRADVLTSVGAALSARSASSTDPVAFAAASTALNSAAANAKAQATVDVSTARNFLHDAFKNLRIMFHLIW